jgi:hypothetical protein
MKKVKEKITAMLNAITFAEMDEAETALSFMDPVVGPVENSLVNHEKDPGIPSHGESSVDAFERSMSAAVFAEAGEFSSANEILHPETKPHIVALVIDNSTPNLHAINYTANLCKRIGAIMDILITESDEVSLGDKDSNHSETLGSVNIPELLQILKDKEVPYHTYMFKGDIVEQLRDYVRRHKEVTTVVYDSPTTQNNDLRGATWHRVLETICKGLSVPLITVFDKRRVKMAT